MKTTLFFVLLVACLVPALAIATEVALPGLVRDYTPGMGVSVSVDFGQPIADVTQVSLELTGIINAGWFIVDADTVSWGGEFSAIFSESDPGFWMAAGAGSEPLNEDFYSLSPFSSLFNATSSFLSDGLAEMYFEFSSLAWVGFIDEVGPSPVGTIYSARLVFEETVAVEPESWGHIKSLFR